MGVKLASAKVVRLKILLAEEKIRNTSLISIINTLIKIADSRDLILEMDVVASV